MTYTAEPADFGKVISQRRGNQSSYYHFDALGSTRVLTDASQNITDTIFYDAWGNVLSQTGSTINPFFYVGEAGYYHDSETNSYYIRARIYEPVLARWWSVDPLRFADGLNPYLYATNSPLNAVDLSGFAVLISPFPASWWLTYRDRPRKLANFKADYFWTIHSIFGTGQQKGEAQPKQWKGVVPFETWQDNQIQTIVLEEKAGKCNRFISNEFVRDIKFYRGFRKTQADDELKLDVKDAATKGTSTNICFVVQQVDKLKGFNPVIGGIQRRYRKEGTRRITGRPAELALNRFLRGPYLVLRTDYSFMDCSVCKACFAQAKQLLTAEPTIDPRPLVTSVFGAGGGMIAKPTKFEMYTVYGKSSDTRPVRRNLMLRRLAGWLTLR